MAPGAYRIARSGFVLNPAATQTLISFVR